MAMTINDEQKQTSCWSRHCAICGSTAIGINFGAPTCAPCKAFFRRNARRKEILTSSCQHLGLDLLSVTNNDDKKIYYSQIRRCSSCRLRRCFDMGMKDELVRTDEENIRHKQLVDMNRRRRALYRQRQTEKQLLIPKCIVNNNELLRESDWRHLSNLVSAYDTYCLKTHLQQRLAILKNETNYQYEYTPSRHFTTLPKNLTTSVFSFLRALPAVHSLSHIDRTYVCTHNLRSLIFLNMCELNQSCFSEPWQASLDESTWKLICGPQLFEQFVRTEKLARRSLITDPIITRLLMVILFFSSSLFSVYESHISVKILKKNSAINDTQNAYVTLLWNYLLHRYGNLAAIQIYSNLIHVYLSMQRIGFAIGVRIRTRNELMMAHEILDRLVTLEIRDI